MNTLKQHFPVGMVNPNRNCYYDPVTAIAVASVAGAGASVISARKQEKSAKSAQEAQQRELDKQADIRAKQDKLTAERTTRAEAATTERRARLSQGKKGLLFEGNEEGVAPTDVLGG